MARWKVLFRCIGEAVRNQGLRALADLVPMGGVLYDIAADACQRLRESEQDDQIRELVQQVAAASAAEVKEQAQEVAQEVAGDQPEEIRRKLAAYLTGVPAAIRQSLRRPADPEGKSVPISFSFQRPEDLLQLLPPRLPRFKPGDRPAGLGDWELVDLLGVGGFGEVWLARHAYFDGIPPAALKFCLDPAARDRLLKHEATVLNQVMRHGRHPGIVPLLDASLSSDPPCLKYEYVPGGDLAGLVRDWPEGPGAPRWEAAARVVLDLARIVGYAHKLSPPIVHRDLKPANVLVAAPPHPPGPPLPPAGERGEQERSGSPSPLGWERGLGGEGGVVLKITDFGIGGVAALPSIAQARQGTTTRGDLLGTSLRGSHTPLYASPQQIRGEAPDPRDDVHALGVIWYQLLTGDLGSGAPTGMWTEDLAETGMPAGLIRLLGMCVHAKAERRPADAVELAGQLEKLLAPPTTPPPPPPPVKVKEKTPPPPSPSPEPAGPTIEPRLTRFLQSGQTGALSWMLDLTNKGIGDEGVKMLASCLKLANLSVLILSGNQVGDEGIKALAASPHAMNLTRLILWDNRISDEGVRALAESRFLSNLTHLDLGRNRVGDEGIKALSASAYMANLGALILVSNHIGDEGAFALAASPHLANLAELKPLENRITAPGVKALQERFGKRVRIF